MSQKIKLTNKDSFESFIAGRSRDYTEMFGASMSHFFKIFTTKSDEVGYARYGQSIFNASGIIPTGLRFVGADPSGLNPFGPNSFGEGLIWGQTRPDNLETLNIPPSDVRTFGHKNPANYVGWGFDIFGYPSPNSVVGWNASGFFGGVAPSQSGFLGTGLAPVNHGSLTPHPLWNAGPQDLRWDNMRKVWTAPQSVHAANILACYSTGALVTDSTSPIFASGLAYDAIITDMAHRVVVTGVSHIGPKPYNDNYKVHPLSSGDFCFVVHTSRNGIPSYGIFLIEPPGTDNCSSVAGTGDAGGDPYADADVGYLSYTSLVGAPLGITYGGTGYDEHPANSILLGNPNASGDLMQYQFTAGTGIEFSNDGSNFYIKLSSGVAFTSGGINTSITELQGLSTPLSIAQGGTSSSVKAFVDLSTAQSVGGTKSFVSGIRVTTGNYSAPSISFTNQSNAGLYSLTTMDGVGIAASGVDMWHVRSEGSTTYGDITIASTVNRVAALNDNSYAPLIVTQYSDLNYNNPIQIWKDRYNTSMSWVDYNGQFIGRGIISSGMTAEMVATTGYNLMELHRPSDSFQAFTIKATALTSGVYFSVNRDGTYMTLGASGNQTVLASTSGDRTIHFSSGYHGNVDVAKVGGGTRTLQFMHGIFVGYTDS